MIKLTINKNTYEFEKGITLLEVSDYFKSDFKYDILVGQVDGDMRDLNYKLLEDLTLNFLIYLHISVIRYMKEDYYLSW